MWHRRARAWLWLASGGLVLLLLVSEPALRCVRAHRFLTRLAEPVTAGYAQLVEGELSVPGTRGSFRARIYRAQGVERAPGVVVAHGVHHRGIDEPRLLRFARELARSGFVVLTPELSELADYRLTRDSVERIRDATLFLAARRDWVKDEPLRLIGFSFAGGLSLVAASEPPLAGRLAYVVSVGGHHDLTRVSNFLLSNRVATPTGIVEATAHEYGLVIVLLRHLGQFVPPAELPALDAAFRAWLQEDRPRARQLAAAFPQGSESERLFRLLSTQQLRSLAPALSAGLEREREQLARLSPRGKLGRIRAPVYVLHGSRDSVIPASEASFAAVELGANAHAALISPLIDHVEVADGPSLLDELALLAFMARLF